MASSSMGLAILGIIIVVLIAVGVLYLYHSKGGFSTLAVQMTDPPKVPAGTSALVIAYSSVKVHAGSATSNPANETNQSGWYNADGSSSVNLLAVTNVSQTIATTQVPTNSIINIVRFNITSATITINGTTYNVTNPNGQINVAVRASPKINASSAAVLIDFRATVNTQGNASSHTYLLVPAATAIVVNANSSVSINTNIGGQGSISASSRARLNLGLNVS